MAVIRGVDGKVYDYAEYEDEVKPRLKEKMRKGYEISGRECLNGNG